MPTYEYQCPACRRKTTEIHRAGDKPTIVCRDCHATMSRLFPTPNLITDTTFLAGRPEATRRGHGFYSHQFQRTFYSRDEVRRYAEENGHGVTGLGPGMDVKMREPEEDPLKKPYTVADDIVADEVERIVETEHDGRATPRQREKIREAASERLAGTAGKKK